MDDVENFTVLDEVGEGQDSNLPLDNETCNADSNVEIALDNSELVTSQNEEWEKDATDDTIEEGNFMERQEENNHEVGNQFKQKDERECKLDKTSKEETGKSDETSKSEIFETNETLGSDKSDVNDDPHEEDKADCERETHPYLYLIETFVLPKHMMDLTVGKVKTLEEKPFQMISTKIQLQKMLQTLRNVTEIALDVYCAGEEFRQPACIIAISTTDTNYLIDVLKLKHELLMLTEIFINSQIVKILFASKNILAQLQQKFHLYMVNIFDVVEARHRALGPKKYSLSGLIRKDYSFNRVLKSKADYRSRPLTEEIKNFTLSGTHYLIYFYYDCKNKLLSKSSEEYKHFLDWCREQSKIVYPVAKKMELQDLQRQLGKRHKCEREVLKKLVDWRNSVAKKKNIKAVIVLNNASLFRLVKELPSDDALVNINNSAHLKNNWNKVQTLINESKTKFRVRDLPPPGKKKKERAGAFKRKMNNHHEVPLPKQRHIEQSNESNNFQHSPGKQKFQYKHRQNESPYRDKKFLQNNAPILGNNNFRTNPFATESLPNTNIAFNIPSLFESLDKRQNNIFGGGGRNRNFTMSGAIAVNPPKITQIAPFQSAVSSVNSRPYSSVGSRNNQEDNRYYTNLNGSSDNIKKRAVNSEQNMLYQSLVDLKKARDSVQRQCGNLSGSFQSRKFQDLKSIDQEITRLERHIEEGRNIRTRNDDNSIFRRRY